MISWCMGGARIAGGGGGDAEGYGARGSLSVVTRVLTRSNDGGDGDGEGPRVSRSVIRVRTRSSGGGDRLLSLWTILSRNRTGDGLLSLSMTLSRYRMGDGDRSRTLSLVSITRARNLSGGGVRDLSRSITLVLTRSTGAGDGDLSRSIILSRMRTGLGDLGLRSIGLVKVSVWRCLNTNGPPSSLP